ncbi:MAG: hypothetical protein EA398_16145 [Deltaproteobacteria bacterium]|nr:MAG: hypothetical protein EA398_16145 [Deltaproteobacteria bacterium]
MELVPLALDAFPEKLQHHVAPDAAPPRKLMAIRGLVPASPTELLMVLHQLSLDDDEKVRSAAVEALVDMPWDVFQPALSGLRHPAVLTGIAVHRNDEESLEQVILHPRVSDDLVLALSRTVPSWLADVIAENQVRLLRTPKIIEALYLNEQTLMSTVHRIVEFARRNDVAFSDLPALQGLLRELEAEELGSQDEERDGAFALLLQEGLAEEEEEERRAKDRGPLQTGEEEESAEKSRKGSNRAAEIDNMNLSEKIRLATLGSQGDRDYLIRNSNRLVHMAAVTSPKIQPKDIHTWAANRSLPDGVITYIANHREYSRNYQILVRLMNNPKMPHQLATRKLTQLNKNDLKKLMKNRNVSPMLQRQAKAMVDQMEKKKR